MWTKEAKMDFRCCDNCKNFRVDWSCGTSECVMYERDYMTEDELEKYYGEGEPDCPYHKYITEEE